MVINWSNMLHRTIPKGNPPYEHINNQCIVHVISHHLPMQHVELFNYESFTLKTVENLFTSSRR